MMSKVTRAAFLKIVLSVTLVLFGFLWLGTAKVMAADCEHEVYCDDETFTCIICGEEYLEEKEIAKVVHPFAYCYDLCTCGACKASIEEGSAEDIRHSLEEHATYYQDGDYHIAECYCKEESEQEKHIVNCTKDDICFLCGGAATSMQKIVKHEDEHLCSDADYHWRECGACNKITLPKFEHYTDCIDKDGPCGYCDRSHKECNFIEGNVGVHKLIHEISGEGEESHHVATCLACDEVIMEHKGIIYNDFGSGEEHGVRCAECDYGFNDEPHIYENGICTLCGHKQQSDPVPTGDESNTILWILILAGALTCMFFCVTISRKKEK